MHLLRVSDLSTRDIETAIHVAESFRETPRRSVDLLRGDSVVLYFSKPSTRTRVSFETAIHRLGGVPVSIGPSDSQLGRGETIEDSARVLSRFCRAFVARTYADSDLQTFASAATIPVVNALTDGHHPCQALADLMTLKARFGKLSGLRVGYFGAGNNVTHSLAEACASVGAHLRIATPTEFKMDRAVLARAQTIARSSGGSVEETSADEAADGANALYTDTWLSMGDPEHEIEMRREVLGPYRVTRALMERARPDAIFMHCLPAHRGDEVTAEVIDGPSSVVFDQAENRLHTALAVLELLLTGRFEGPR